MMYSRIIYSLFFIAAVAHAANSEHCSAEGEGACVPEEEVEYMEASLVNVELLQTSLKNRKQALGETPKQLGVAANIQFVPKLLEIDTTSAKAAGKCKPGEQITTPQACLLAAQALNLPITNKEAHVYNSNWGPPGCWAQSGTFLQFNEFEKENPDCTNFAQCLCESSPYYKQTHSQSPSGANTAGKCKPGEQITTPQACLLAAQALNLPITNKEAHVYKTNWGPPGCWAQDGKFLQFNEFEKANPDCTNFAQCLCESSPCESSPYYKQEGA